MSMKLADNFQIRKYSWPCGACFNRWKERPYIVLQYTKVSKISISIIPRIYMIKWIVLRWHYRLQLGSTCLILLFNKNYWTSSQVRQHLLSYYVIKLGQILMAGSKSLCRGFLRFFFITQLTTLKISHCVCGPVWGRHPDSNSSFLTYVICV
jgi:hypothetical protein